MGRYISTSSTLIVTVLEEYTVQNILVTFEDECINFYKHALEFSLKMMAMNT